MAMSNLTISIDDRLIKQARIRVAQQGTSLSAKVRELLQQYVNGTDDATKRLREEATANLMLAIERATLATQAPVPSKEAGPQKTLREEIYAGNFRANDRSGTGLNTNPSAQDKT
jgi:plasmid stability protein